MLKLDEWQEKVLKTKGNLCICSGRQVGKSTIISQDAGDYASNNRNKSIMIIAATERQALLLFEKVFKLYYSKIIKALIQKGRKKPQNTKLNIKKTTQL